jgi:hypothetical protein
MLTSLFGRCIGLSIVVCVLLLFFFPLAQGNFASTHGPVTALRSKRSLLLLVWSIVQAALLVLAIRIPCAPFQRCYRFSTVSDQPELSGLDAYSSVLRC